MTADLEQRLRVLADQAPAAVPDADLWRRGRLRQARRAVAGSVAALVFASAAGVGLAAVWRAPLSTPEPANQSGTAQLPDHVYTPGAWLPGTRDAGPIGPLATVVRAERGSLVGRAGIGLVGVSAKTGAYRFLDLPGYDDPTMVDGLVGALSGDGRRLAYWYPGQPSAQPRLDVDGQLPVIGVAVYDTVRGTVQRLPIATEHGLMVDTLNWSGDALFVSVAQYLKGGTAENSSDARGQGIASWQPGQDSWRAVPGSEMLQVMGTSSEGLIVGGLRFVETINADGVRRRIARIDAFNTFPVLSPDGRLVAGTTDPTPTNNDGTPQPLTVVDTTSLQRRQVPGVKAAEVVGWRDATHVVVITDNPSTTIGYDSVDVTTGESTRLMTREWGLGGTMPVAPDLWSAPVVQVKRPDWPASPWAPSAGLTGGLLAAFAGLAWWRRRRVGA